MADLRQFDLNIERVLEHWTDAHAVREIIANAMDEQALTNTSEPIIYKDSNGAWHVRDFGRGIKYEHLTQNENKEKLSSPNKVIGKFGVGLKDALATADRRNIDVLIKSRYGDITCCKASKHGFADVITLHAQINEPSNPDLTGTDFELQGLSDSEIKTAKEFFLRYSGDQLLEQTKYGSVLKKRGDKARIYVNGLVVAEEENFLFSYNITSLTSTLRKALNRERTNVGRSAYTDRVKAILLECTASNVAAELASDLHKSSLGTGHDEILWLDVAQHACRILNANEKVLFVTSTQLMSGGSSLSHAVSDGYKIVVVPDTIGDKLKYLTDIDGKPVYDLNRYVMEWNDSFEFSFIPPDKLTPAESSVFALKDSVFNWLGHAFIGNVASVVISETMRLETSLNHDAVGLWVPASRQIIIKRSQLVSVQDFLATLLHEIAHAFTGADDLSSIFENGLTSLLGVTGQRALRQTTGS